MAFNYFFSLNDFFINLDYTFFSSNKIYLLFFGSTLGYKPYILIFKILILCVFAIGIRGTVPRYRLDQLTQLNWKYFIFLWLIFFTYTLLTIILYN